MIKNKSLPLAYYKVQLFIIFMIFRVSVVVIDCGNLKPPANGEVELSGTVFGSLANYSCDPSFRLIGSEIRICLENREWSPDAPICERKYTYKACVETIIIIINNQYIVA